VRARVNKKPRTVRKRPTRRQLEAELAAWRSLAPITRALCCLVAREMQDSALAEAATALQSAIAAAGASR
jgi:hypothetical protein